MGDPTPELLEGFKPPATPGSFFVSFEGIEASGKSSQLLRTKAHLERHGLRVLDAREPGGTPFGERLRQAILRSTSPVHPLAEACLFASSRAQLLSQVVLRELAEPGTAVLCDRHIDSSLAYQGVARGLGVDRVLALHSSFPLSVLPHLTLYLRVSPAASLERRSGRAAPGDYFESHPEAFHRDLVKGFDLAARLFPGRIRTIDGEAPFDEVSRGVLSAVDALVEGGGARGGAPRA